MDTNTNNNMGKVVQIMGPVIDVEFKNTELPPIYTALKLTNHLISDEKWNLIVEVAQQLGLAQVGATTTNYSFAVYPPGMSTSNGSAPSGPPLRQWPIQHPQPFEHHTSLHLSRFS